MTTSSTASIFKNRFFIVSCCLLAGVVVNLVSKRLTITVTDSVKHRVFWTKKTAQGAVGIKKNIYVRLKKRLELPGPDFGKDVLLVKRVGCAPGQRLEVRNKAFYCDEQLLGVAERKEFYRKSGVIPESRVFLIGDNPRSYDSRYFGLAEVKDIDATLTPVF